MYRFADGADRLGEAGGIVMRRHVASLEMHVGNALVIAGDEAEQDFGKEAALFLAEAANDAHVDGDDMAGVVDEQVALVHVGMEEAVAQRVPQERLDQRIGQRIEVVA
ncbi:hypothetical protein D3C87_1801020 [compost metagenome]